MADPSYSEIMAAFDADEQGPSGSVQIPANEYQSIMGAFDAEGPSLQEIMRPEGWSAVPAQATPWLRHRPTSPREMTVEEQVRLGMAGGPETRPLSERFQSRPDLAGVAPAAVPEGVPLSEVQTQAPATGLMEGAAGPAQALGQYVFGGEIIRGPPSRVGEQGRRFEEWINEITGTDFFDVSQPVEHGVGAERARRLRDISRAVGRSVSDEELPGNANVWLENALLQTPLNVLSGAAGIYGSIFLMPLTLSMIQARELGLAAGHVAARMKYGAWSDESAAKGEMSNNAIKKGLTSGNLSTAMHVSRLFNRAEEGAAMLLESMSLPVAAAIHTPGDMEAKMDAATETFWLYPIESLAGPWMALKGGMKVRGTRVPVKVKVGKVSPLGDAPSKAIQGWKEAWQQNSAANPVGRAYKSSKAAAKAGLEQVKKESDPGTWIEPSIFGEKMYYETPPRLTRRVRELSKGKLAKKEPLVLQPWAHKVFYNTPEFLKPIMWDTHTSAGRFLISFQEEMKPHKSFDSTRNQRDSIANPGTLAYVTEEIKKVAAEQHGRPISDFDAERLAYFGQSAYVMYDKRTNLPVVDIAKAIEEGVDNLAIWAREAESVLPTPKDADALQELGMFFEKIGLPREDIDANLAYINRIVVDAVANNIPDVPAPPKPVAPPKAPAPQKPPAPRRLVEFSDEFTVAPARDTKGAKYAKEEGLSFRHMFQPNSWNGVFIVDSAGNQRGHLKIRHQMDRPLGNMSELISKSREPQILQSLYDRFGDAPVEQFWTTEIDYPLRGRGVGVELFEQAIDSMRKKHPDGFYMISPHEGFVGEGSVTGAGQSVLDSLAKRYPSEGSAIYVGPKEGVPASQKQTPPKRVVDFDDLVPWVRSKQGEHNQIGLPSGTTTETMLIPAIPTRGKRKDGSPIYRGYSLHAVLNNDGTYTPVFAWGTKDGGRKKLKVVGGDSPTTLEGAKERLFLTVRRVLKSSGHADSYAYTVFGDMITELKAPASQKQATKALTAKQEASRKRAQAHLEKNRKGLEKSKKAVEDAWAEVKRQTELDKDIFSPQTGRKKAEKALLRAQKAMAAKEKLVRKWEERIESWDKPAAPKPVATPEPVAPRREVPAAARAYLESIAPEGDFSDIRSAAHLYKTILDSATGIAESGPAGKTGATIGRESLVALLKKNADTIRSEGAWMEYIMTRNTDGTTYKWIPGGGGGRAATAFAGIAGKMRAQKKSMYDIPVGESGALVTVQMEPTFGKIVKKISDRYSNTPEQRAQKEALFIELLRTDPSLRLSVDKDTPLLIRTIAREMTDPKSRLRPYYDITAAQQEALIEILGIAPETIFKRLNTYTTRAWNDATEAYRNLQIDREKDIFGTPMRKTPQRHKRVLSDVDAQIRLYNMHVDDPTGFISEQAVVNSITFTDAIIANLDMYSQLHDQLQANGMLFDKKRAGYTEVPGIKDVTPEGKAHSGNPYNFVYGKLAGKWVPDEMATSLRLARDSFSQTPQFLTTFKILHTMYNLPGYQIRNALGDSLNIANRSGLMPWDRRWMSLSRQAEKEAAAWMRDGEKSTDVDFLLRGAFVDERGAGASAITGDMPVAHQLAAMNADHIMPKVIDGNDFRAPALEKKANKIMALYQFGQMVTPRWVRKHLKKGLADRYLRLREAFVGGVGDIEPGVMSGPKAIWARGSRVLRQINQELADTSIARWTIQQETQRRIFAYKIGKQVLGLSDVEALQWARDTLHDYGARHKWLRYIQDMNSHRLGVITSLAIPPFATYGVKQSAFTLRNAFNNPKALTSWMILHAMNAYDEQLREDIDKNIAGKPMSGKTQAFMDFGARFNIAAMNTWGATHFVLNSGPDLGNTLQDTGLSSPFVRAIEGMVGGASGRGGKQIHLTRTLNLRDIGNTSNFLMDFQSGSSLERKLARMSPFVDMAISAWDGLRNGTFRSQASGDTVISGEPKLSAYAYRAAQQLTHIFTPVRSWEKSGPMSLLFGENRDSLEAASQGHVYTVKRKQYPVDPVAALSKGLFPGLGITAISQFHAWRQIKSAAKAKEFEYKAGYRRDISQLNPLNESDKLVRSRVRLMLGYRLRHNLLRMQYMLGNKTRAEYRELYKGLSKAWLRDERRLKKQGSVVVGELGTPESNMSIRSLLDAVSEVFQGGGASDTLSEQVATTEDIMGALE
tara:strand:+ start:1399 stop:7890 length:6492 start_codon:yes stop_codon:yes gene_type:complete